ncbi:MAG: hypothetical protein E3J94_03340 [Desulfobacteraceae bacterium]|nr:MAG: hypothetical protein E3J94_03340 [Desulfobacteraceae bacterium]
MKLYRSQNWKVLLTSQSGSSTSIEHPATGIASPLLKMIHPTKNEHAMWKHRQRQLVGFPVSGQEGEASLGSWERTDLRRSLFGVISDKKQNE